MHEPKIRNDSGMWQLAIVALTLALVWLIVLPGISRQSRYRRYADWVTENNIDASAMFYTELPNLDATLARMGSWRRRHPHAMWRPQELRRPP